MVECAMEMAARHMRVAMYYNNQDIRLEDMSIPKIGKGEILVKVIASGICGSDVMEWYRIQKAPLILGHEITGEVVEVGNEVPELKQGNRVFVSHHVPCNSCRYCLSGNHTVCDMLRSTNFDPGGFAEYIRVPHMNVSNGTFLLPEGISFEEGTFIEPLACVVRGQEKANLKPGQCVLIIGSGISGILHIQMAHARGAGQVIATDISEYRRAAAVKFGADSAIAADGDIPTHLRKTNDGYLADLVIICTGDTQAISQGMQSVERGGTVLFFAPMQPNTTFPFPIYDLWRNGITLTTSYAGSPSDIATAIELIRFQKVNVHDMITHRLGLADVEYGFKLVSKAQDSLKVIIEPQR